MKPLFSSTLGLEIQWQRPKVEEESGRHFSFYISSLLTDMVKIVYTGHLEGQKAIRSNPKHFRALQNTPK